MNEWIVLSVEDGDSDFNVIQVALKKAAIPIRVYRAVDGEQAISFLEGSAPFANAPTPHMILLDAHMPRRDGLETLKYIAADEALRSIPVVMFTAISDPRERESALALGAKEYLVKNQDLGTMVKELVGVCARFLTNSHSQAADA